MDLPRLTGTDKMLRETYLALDTYFRKDGGIIIWAYSPDLKMGITRKEFLKSGSKIFTKEFKKLGYKDEKIIKVMLINKTTDTRIDIDYFRKNKEFKAVITKGNKTNEYEKISLNDLEQIVINE